MLDLAVWLRQEYALCVNVSCLSCEPELNHVEIEAFCLELAKVLNMPFSTLKSFKYSILCSFLLLFT